MIEKIDFFVHRASRYGVLLYFTERLSEALTRLGVRTRLLDSANPEDLKAVAGDRPDCTLSFNGLLPDKGGDLLCDFFKVPHVAYLVDPSHHFLALTKSPYTVIACVDRMGCDLLRSHGFDRTLFLPHAAEGSLPPSDGERVFDLVMFSTCVDYEKYRNEWYQHYSKSFCEVIEAAAEMVLTRPNISHMQAFLVALNESEKARQELVEEKIDLDEVWSSLELYIKGKDRIELLRGIEGVDIHLFGSVLEGKDWEKYVGHKKNLRHHGEVSFEEACRVMGQAKLVVSSCPTIKDGGHERIFSSLLKETPIFSMENVFLDAHLSEQDGVIRYQHDRMDRMNERIAELLGDEDKRHAMGKRGREKVLSAHTWDHRAKTLLEELPALLDQIARTV